MASWQHHSCTQSAERQRRAVSTCLSLTQPSAGMTTAPPTTLCPRQKTKAPQDQGLGQTGVWGPNLPPAPLSKGLWVPTGPAGIPGEPAGPGPRAAYAFFPGTHLHFHLEPLKPQVHVTDGGVSGTEPADGAIVGDRGPFRLPDFKGRPCWVARPLSLGCCLRGRQTCLPACPSCPD